MGPCERFKPLLHVITFAIQDCLNDIRMTVTENRELSGQ